MPKRKTERKTAHTAFRRIRSLPNFQEVRRRLCAGVSCESVARWLQDDCQMATDAKYPTLVQQLYRYRDTIPLKDRQSTKVVKLYERTDQFRHRVNTLEEMIKVYEYQLVRLNKAIELEDKANMPYGATAKEMDRAMGYLLQIARLKGELGLIDKTGEKDNEGSFDRGVMLGGALSVIAARYGPEAVDKLQHAGKKIQEHLQRMLANPELAGKVKVEVPKHGGNGKESGNGVG